MARLTCLEGSGRNVHKMNTIEQSQQTWLTCSNLALLVDASLCYALVQSFASRQAPFCSYSAQGITMPPATSPSKASQAEAQTFAGSKSFK